MYDRGQRRLLRVLVNWRVASLYIPPHISEVPSWLHGGNVERTEGWLRWSEDSLGTLGDIGFVHRLLARGYRETIKDTAVVSFIRCLLSCQVSSSRLVKFASPSGFDDADSDNRLCSHVTCVVGHAIIGNAIVGHAVVGHAVVGHDVVLP